MITKDFAAVAARLGGVLQNRNALEAMLGDRIDKLLKTMERVIVKHLADVGEEIKNIVIANLTAATPSGRTYTFVNEDGTPTGRTHTASAAGEVPARLSGTLLRSIEFKVHTYDNSVEIGVFSDELGGVPVIKFLPDDHVMIGSGGYQTPVHVYAEALEGGKSGVGPFKRFNIEPRPFLKPAMDEGLVSLRKTLRKQMKEEVLKTMRRKKLPIYFRFTKQQGD